MYFTDRGIEELEERRGDEEVTMAWLAERLRDFVDLNPDFEIAVDRLASWLARLDSEEDLLSRTDRGACGPPPARLRPGAGTGPGSPRGRDGTGPARLGAGTPHRSLLHLFAHVSEGHTDYRGRFELRGGKGGLWCANSSPELVSSPVTAHSQALAYHRAHRHHADRMPGPRARSCAHHVPDRAPDRVPGPRARSRARIARTGMPAADCCIAIAICLDFRGMRYIVMCSG
jgi:hypothetical protein